MLPSHRLAVPKMSCTVLGMQCCVILSDLPPPTALTAQVTAVDTDAQRCTVIFESGDVNSHGTGAGSKQTVPLASVRRRYQAGHIPGIDAGFAALGRFVTKCFGGGLNCCSTHRKKGNARIGSKAVAREDV